MKNAAVAVFVLPYIVVTFALPTFGNYFLAMIETETSIRHVNITRYVTPLREGGSMPALAEADDGFLYVIKFRGAGQGVKALIADFIGGELARVAGLNTPELVFATLDEAFGRTEPDEEIQDLLKASVGLNLGVHYLSGSITYDALVTKLDADLASKIIWLDAFLTNVDRTVKNTNMLTWNKQLWLIDHGASLYFHHSWDNWQEQAIKPFVMIKDHVLLPMASNLKNMHDDMLKCITPEVIQDIVNAIPEVWLANTNVGLSAPEVRDVYQQFLTIRLAHSSTFLNEAIHAREKLI